MRKINIGVDHLWKCGSPESLCSSGSFFKHIISQDKETSQKINF